MGLFNGKKKKYLDLGMNKSAKKIIAKNINLRAKKGSIDKVLKKRPKKIIKFSIR